MKNAFFSRYLILFLVFAPAACKLQSHKNGRQISESYLNSNSFKSFQQEARRERQQSVKRHHKLGVFVGRALAQISGKSLDQPTLIDGPLIEQAISKLRNGPPLTMTIFGSKLLYYPIGRLDSPRITYHFFLMCKVGSVDRCVVWAATAINRELKAIKMIAPYYRALSYREVPQIWVRPPSIKVRVNKYLKYPVQQERSFNMSFRVDSDGNIRRRKE